MDGAGLDIDAVQPDEPPNWYVVQLKPGGLDRARTNLARQGVTSFMPLRSMTMRRNGRLAMAKRPLFPGYLFIAIGPGAPPWRAINSTYGVAKTVCLEPGRPVRVPSALMSALRARCTTVGDYCSDHESFAPDDNVRVVLGPFAGLLAKVEAVPERERIFVLLDIMGRAVRAQVRAIGLERV